LLSKAALDEMRNLSGEAPRLVLGEVHLKLIFRYNQAKND
jgi:hypothetical protein